MGSDGTLRMIGPPMRNDHDLDAAAKVTEVLERRQIDDWRFGGWAVSRDLGRVTRQHTDVDIVIWRAHLDRTKRAAGQADRVRPPDDRPWAGQCHGASPQSTVLPILEKIA
jgi:hypothetical protein